MLTSNQHIIKSFDEELTKLRFRLVKMGSLVQQQVEHTIKALSENSIDLAKMVIENDDKVDKLDIKIDKQCLRIFALHQPMAMDLRLVMSAYSINDDMELIGDLTSNIAKNILEMGTIPSIINQTKLIEMGNKVKLLVEKVLDSFIFSNVELSREALKLASEIKKLSKENFNLLIEIMQNNPIYIKPCSYMIDINRNIFFISEQGRSIALELIFLMEAKIYKHKKELLLLLKQEDYINSLQDEEQKEDEKDNKQE